MPSHSQIAVPGAIRPAFLASLMATAAAASVSAWVARSLRTEEQHTGKYIDIYLYRYSRIDRPLVDRIRLSAWVAMVSTSLSAQQQSLAES